VPYFDIIRGTSVEYMHCILLGVCRHLLLQTKVITVHLGILARISNDWIGVYYSINHLMKYKEPPAVLENTVKFWKGMYPQVHYVSN
jgi:hypothetical protein